jgi:hypothetical protein
MESRVCGTFTSPEDFHFKVAMALSVWRGRHPEMQSPSENPFLYIEYLRKQTGWIEIRGMGVGAVKAHRFPIDDLYIPLSTTAGPQTREELTGRRLIPLEQSLDYRRLLIVGVPGSGKTTFLRWCAFRACEAFKTGSSSRLPVFIRAVDLVQHINHSLASKTSHPSTGDSPEWLVHFLDTRAREWNWNLSGEFFREKLNSGNVLLLLDGLDEAPTARDREGLARLIERVTLAWRDCNFVVTTRPAAYAGRSVSAEFTTALIAPLEQDAIEAFLRRWCGALFPDSPKGAESHFRELNDTLRNRIEIRHMAENPVMLTALAVLHWNQRRLPEQRVQLYEAILQWLAGAREQRPGRETSERRLALLQDLALAMQSNPDGRQAEVSIHQAAQVIAQQFRVETDAERLAQAESFLSEEELDSGIIVSRGDAIRFLYLAFQEYLAACALAGRSEARQHELLFAEDNVYRPDWRETVLLLVGMLARQGQREVDALFTAVLDRLGRAPTLGERARCVGLLGEMLQVLQPLGYSPRDQRYPSVLESVLDVFAPDTAAGIDFRVRLDAAEALGQSGDPRLKLDNWVEIEACEVWIGAQPNDVSSPNYDSASQDNEQPVHRVQLDAYEIGRYPVTVDEYARFVRGDGYEDARWWQLGGFGPQALPEDWGEQILHPNRPVVGVCRGTKHQLTVPGQAFGCSQRPSGNAPPAVLTARSILGETRHLTPQTLTMPTAVLDALHPSASIRRAPHPTGPLILGATFGNGSRTGTVPMTKDY